MTILEEAVRESWMLEDGMVRKGRMICESVDT